jgi:hypothetical protein
MLEERMLGTGEGRERANAEDGELPRTSGQQERLNAGVSERWTIERWKC